MNIIVTFIGIQAVDFLLHGLEQETQLTLHIPCHPLSPVQAIHLAAFAISRSGLSFF